MKIKKLLQDYIQKMEYDKVCGEIALEITQENLAEMDEKIKKAKKADKENLVNRRMMLEGLVEQYHEYIQTAIKSRKKAQNRLKKVGLA